MVGKAWRQRLVLGLEREERLAAALPRHQVAHARQQAEAAGVGQQQHLLRVPCEVVRGLRARLEVDERRDRLAVAAPARQQVHAGRVHAAVAAEHEQRVDGAAGEGPVEAVARLELQRRGVHLVALQRAHPALQAHHHRDRLVEHLHFGDRALVGLDQRAPLVAVLLRVGLDLADHRALQRGRAAEDVLQLALLGAQLLQLLLDPDRLQPRQLAQPDLEDVLGLPVAQLEALDERGLGLFGVADDADHLVDVQQHELPAFEDVDAVEHLAEPVAGAPLHRLHAEVGPLDEHLAQALLRGPAVGAHHREIHRRGGLEAGVGEQRADEIVLVDAAGLRLEHDAHRRVLARLVAHRVEHRQHGGLELRLLGAHRLLAGLHLRIGELLDLLEHLLRAGAGRQLGDHELPLAARQVLDLPQRAHLQAAAAGGVGGANLVGAADHLAAAGIVRPGHVAGQLVVGKLRVADQRHRGAGHLAQVVRRHLGGQAHCDAAGAVQQHEGQPRRELLRLLGGAVVVRDELDRALVDLVEQQARDGREARLGVAHRRRAVAVARAEVALAVDQRVAQREVLRHAHERVVRRLVAVRMKAAEHVTDDARALDRLRPGAGREHQAHPGHRVEDAALHRLLAVGDVGKRAPLDDRERVLEVGALGVFGERDDVVGGRSRQGIEEVGGQRRQGTEAAAGSAAARAGEREILADGGCRLRATIPASRQRRASRRPPEGSTP